MIIGYWLALTLSEKDYGQAVIVALVGLMCIVDMAANTEHPLVPWLVPKWLRDWFFK